MPNLTLTPSEASRFLPLPGHALIFISPAETTTSTGLHLPADAADREKERQAVRKGVLVKINIEGKREMEEFAGGNEDLEWGVAGGYAKGLHPFIDEDSDALLLGKEVYYLGHADEADNVYVVVLIGQIVAVAV